jgi:hypothetical protein
LETYGKNENPENWLVDLTLRVQLSNPHTSGENSLPKASLPTPIQSRRGMDVLP